MKILRTLLVILTYSGLVLTGQAQDYSLKIVDLSDLSYIFEVDRNLRVDVADGAMKVTSPDRNIEVQLTDIKSYSYVKSSGLDSGPDPTGSLRITDRSIAYSAPSTEVSSYAIFNASGAKVAAGSFAGEVAIDLSNFEAGIYIINIEGLSPVKFVVR